jgi:ABC-type methionine transport system ATPase subunit
MILVTHETQFPRDIADRIPFFEAGRIVESGAPEQIFSNPQHGRTREFLKKVRIWIIPGDANRGGTLLLKAPPEIAFVTSCSQLDA